MTQDSFRLLGAFAVTAYLITCQATNFAVTKSARVMRSSLTDVANLTSPILSVKYGAQTQSALFGIRSQHSVIFLKDSIASFIKFMLDSFQSFIFILMNRAVASKITASGFSSSIYCCIPLNPSTLSCHLASSNLATWAFEQNDSTFSIASSLLIPAPISSSFA